MPVSAHANTKFVGKESKRKNAPKKMEELILRHWLRSRESWLGIGGQQDAENQAWWGKKKKGIKRKADMCLS